MPRGFFGTLLGDIIIIGIVWGFSPSCRQKMSGMVSPENIEINVGIFQDPRLPQLNSQDISQILGEAQKMLTEKFGKLNLQFTVIENNTLDYLFLETEKESREFKKYITDLPNVLVYNEMTWNAHFDSQRQEVEKFLTQGWSKSALRQYVKFNNYQELLNILRKTWYTKLQYMRTYLMKNSSPLFSENYRLHSYLAWHKLMQVQSKYDLILTNTIFYYDNLTQAYPHVIFKHAKISGGSFESPNRPGYLAGVSAMASVFELYSDEDYFKGPKTLKMKKLDREFMNKAIGGYLLAHELGHQIYWIPDVYDHPRGCLMDTKYENLEIGDGYRQLLENQVICPKCQFYVQSRNDLMSGHYYLLRKDKDKGSNFIRRGLKGLPNVMDRDKQVISRYYEDLIKSHGTP